jgi:hypothetical protein
VGVLVALHGALGSRGEPPRTLRADDEIHVIAQMAGG